MGGKAKKEHGDEDGSTRKHWTDNEINLLIHKLFDPDGGILPAKEAVKGFKQITLHICQKVKLQFQSE